MNTFLILSAILYTFNVASADFHFKKKSDIRREDAKNPRMFFNMFTDGGRLDDEGKWTCKNGCEEIKASNYFVCVKCKKDDDDKAKRQAASELPLNEEQKKLRMIETNMAPDQLVRSRRIAPHGLNPNPTGMASESLNTKVIIEKKPWVCKKGCERIAFSNYYVCKDCKPKPKKKWVCKEGCEQIAMSDYFVCKKCSVADCEKCSGADDSKRVVNEELVVKFSSN